MDPHVKASVMFGRGKFNAGVLIDPRPEFVFDPADETKLIDFRNAIWCAILLTYPRSSAHREYYPGPLSRK